MFNSPTMGIHRGVATPSTPLERIQSTTLAGCAAMTVVKGSWLLNNSLTATTGNVMSSSGYTAPATWNSDKKIYTPYFLSTLVWNEGNGMWDGGGNVLYTQTDAVMYGDKSALSFMCFFRQNVAQVPCGSTPWAGTPDGNQVIMGDVSGMGMGGGTMFISINPDGKLVLSINSVGYGANIIAPSALTVDNVFHHVCGTWTAANGGTLFLYLDKVLIATATGKGAITGFPDPMFGSAYNQLWLGATVGDFGAGNFFTGDISQPKLLSSKVGVDLLTPIYNQGIANLATYVDNRDGIKDYK